MDTAPIFRPGSRPAECPGGHRWGPGRAYVGWMPCGECPAGLANFNGHHYLRCKLCRWEWFYPAHEGQEWVQVGLRPR